MHFRILVLLLFTLFSTSVTTSTSQFTTHNFSLILDDFYLLNDAKIESTYTMLKLSHSNIPTKESFTKAVEGYNKLKVKGIIKKDLITLLDFSLSSKVKRLWVIDLKNQVILFNSFVAHGRNSGGEFAHQFSNTPESFKSSLGLYATAETYTGKHGYSLRLDGLENGINNKARERAIVIHGADYVSESFIKQNGRLGRSFGCPSLPNELTKEIIDLIKDKSCLYIYHPSTKK